MPYTHLSQSERYQICVLLRAKHSIRQIASLIHRSTSTVSREIARNSGQRGYRAKQANSLCAQRSIASRNAAWIEPSMWRQVALFLDFEHSPEQIAARLGISHQSIYAHIMADRQAGGQLWRKLRCANKRRKRYGTGVSRQGQIPNRRSIKQRDPAIENRAQIGHWEVDTVIGANHQHAIVSLVERRSGFVLLKKVANKSAHDVEQAVCAMLKPYLAKVKTITSDNGKEFANHQSMERELSALWYFADPYCSWQRGSNENMNGLVRQYVPKKAKLCFVTDEDLDRYQNRLNTRPRKRLGFRTPQELFFQSLRRVAPRT
jgi:transposase, IS30 family